MGAGAQQIATQRTVDEIKGDIAAALLALPKLRAELKVAEAAERTRRLAAVEADYRAGVDLTVIRDRHKVTTGQIAGWAFRGGWERPLARVNDLAPNQVTLYRDFRVGRTKAAAVRLASEASPFWGRPAPSTWGDRGGCGAQSARLSGAPTPNRSPLRNQAPDRHVRVRALGSSGGERSSATKPLNTESMRRHGPEVGSG